MRENDTNRAKANKMIAGNKNFSGDSTSIIKKLKRPCKVVARTNPPEIYRNLKRFLMSERMRKYPNNPETNA